MDAKPQMKPFPWKLFGGIVVAALAVLVVFLVLQGGGENEPLGVAVMPTNGLSLVDIKAENGVFSPREFSVKRPHPVMVTFTAVDDKYDIGFADRLIGFDVIAEEGEVERFGFETKDKSPGLYTFQCIQFCPQGPMEGTMKVE